MLHEHIVPGVGELFVRPVRVPLFGQSKPSRKVLDVSILAWQFLRAFKREHPKSHRKAGWSPPPLSAQPEQWEKSFRGFPFFEQLHNTANIPNP